MNPVLVLCPTRGRPERAKAMWRSFVESAALPTTRLVLVVDHDDPKIAQYPPRGGFTERYGWDPDAPFVLGLEPALTGNLTKATNTAASRFWRRDVIFGHVGDDHLFRTPGWDRRIAETLTTPGIAYGDDLLQGEALPTAVFMSSAIPRALGWFALPTTTHSHIDNAWKRLGEELNCLHYLPDVVIEHMHPGAGKAKRDAGYRAAGRAGVPDGHAFAEWERTGLAADVARVRAALAVAA